MLAEVLEALSVEDVAKLLSGFMDDQVRECLLDALNPQKRIEVDTLRQTLGTVDAPVPLSGEAVIRVQSLSLNRGEVRGAQNAAAGARPGWIGYVGVDDVDATAAKAARGGVWVVARCSVRSF